MEDEDKSLELKGEPAASSLERSRAGSGLVEGGRTGKVVGNSGVSFESETFSPKLGGNLSLLSKGKGELEFNGCTIANGGRTFESALTGAGFAVGGINKGAGCNVELVGVGNEIGGIA